MDNEQIISISLWRRYVGGEYQTGGKVLREVGGKFCLQHMTTALICNYAIINPFIAGPCVFRWRLEGRRCLKQNSPAKLMVEKGANERHEHMKNPLCFNYVCCGRVADPGRYLSILCRIHLIIRRRSRSLILNRCDAI